MSGREQEILFKKWLKRVDTIIFKRIRVHYDDLPDQDYWVHFVNGTKPVEMAKITIDGAFPYLVV